MIRTHLKASGVFLGIVGTVAACVAYPPFVLGLCGLVILGLVYGLAYAIVSPDDGVPGW